jgi:hypothetical protein
MVSSLSRKLLLASVTAALAAPLATSASADMFSSPRPLNLDAPAAQPASDAAQPDAAQQEDQPKYLAEAAAAPPGPQIHGFFDSPFKTAYITPRGLFVENQGLVWQPVVGLVFPLPDIGIKNFSLDAGIWNSVTTNQGDPRVGAWNEMDVWVGFGGDIMKNLSFHVDYEAWNFPNSTINKPSTEHVSQFKLSYDDSEFWGKTWGGFALHPYVNFFYEWAGSSTVVLGRSGGTYYVEPGIVPTFTWNLGQMPLTFAFPTYVQIGPASYWGKGGDALHKPDGNVGVISTGVTLTVPLKFVPVQYGNWHAEAGLLYYYLGNDALRRAGNLLSGNTDRNAFNAYVGIGVGF